jgi:carbon monoxide dehydrogenase subunit G
LAETEYATSTRLPIQTIWNFVEDMDNWAHFLTGYVSHEKQSETESEWTLKGDVGVLARTVKFKVQIVEWAEPERVRFTLLGLNEQLEGEGEFRVGASGQASTAVAAPHEGLVQQLLAWLARLLYRARYGASQRGADADAPPGEGLTELAFRLRIDPGGPTAPMVNAMMKPALPPAAEALANKIVTHLEATN